VTTRPEESTGAPVGSATGDAEAVPRRRRLPGARVLADGAVIYLWGEIALALGFYAVYSAVRNSNQGGTATALRNAENLISTQRFLGLYHEQTLQAWALHFRPLVIGANYYYGSLHFVVTIGCLVFLFVRWRDDYPFWRNTLGISTAIALIGFTFWPLMPPRLLPHSFGFVDTLARYPTFWSFKQAAVNQISNQYAAMPSVHCVWAMWCACVLVPRLRSRWAKVVAVAYPVLTVVAIVLTANHYFLDAVGGFAVLLLGFEASRRFTRAGRGARPSPLPVGVTDSPETDTPETDTPETDTPETDATG